MQPAGKASRPCTLPLAVTSAHDHARYDYDAATGLPARVTQEFDPPGDDEFTDFSYDGDSNLLTVKTILSEAWSYEYDEDGNVTTSTDPAGVGTTFEVDDLGQVTKVIDANGNLTLRSAGPGQERQYVRWERDAAGVCTIYGYEESPGVEKYRDGNGNLRGMTRGVPTGPGCSLDQLDSAFPISVTRYRHDADDRLVRTQQPDGSVTGTIYDAAGRKRYDLHAHRVADGLASNLMVPVDESGTPLGIEDIPKTVYFYNGFGQLEAIGHPKSLPSIYDEDYQALEDHYTFETFGYDASGNRNEQVDISGRQTCFEADGQNRPWKTWLPKYDPQDPDAEELRDCDSIPSGDKADAELLYDDAGRLWKRRVLTNRADGTYQEWSFLYDEAGRRTESHQPEVNGSASITKTEYDLDGRVERVTLPDNSYTTYGYDAAGRKVLETYFRFGGSERAHREWEYDVLGRLKSETDENGRLTRYNHDALGRLTTVTDAEGRVTTYTYDRFGNLDRQRDARNHVTLYEHDVMGRRTGKQLPLGQREVKQYHTVSGQLEKHWPFGANTGAAGEAVQYAYDPVTQRLDEIVYPDGLELEQTYDPDGTLTRLDRNEPVATDTSLVYVEDSRGRPWRTTQADNSVIEHEYDETGFRTSVTVWSCCPDGGGAVIHRLDFTPDERGRLSIVTENDTATARYVYLWPCQLPSA